MLNILSFVGDKIDSESLEEKYLNNDLLLLVDIFHDFIDVWTFFIDSLEIENQKLLLKNVEYITSFVKDGLLAKNKEKQS